MIHLNRLIILFSLIFFTHSMGLLGSLAPAIADINSFNRVEPHLRPLLPSDPFSVDTRLRPQVNFWIQIYSRYTSRQGLIHDAKYIDHIYEEVNFDQIPGSPSEYLKAAKQKWKTLLLSVHRKQNTPELLTQDEKKIYELFRDVNEPNKFLNAAGRKRLRFQQGQKNYFIEGYRQSGLYLGFMEQIFRDAGLPVELTRLPFVESSFNLRARSKVGASGVWQFMRSTARNFLKVNDAVDERNDPIRATEAAAMLLKGNYESLGKWSLAVTAYNHGRKGMMRATRMVGSEELEDVVDTYKSATFGFASGNFFSEFLAALEVERNAEKYLGKIEKLKPMDFFEVRIPDYIQMSELIRFMKLDPVGIRELNPGLTEAVFAGQLLVPAGYFLRIYLDPSFSKETATRAFLAGYSEIPSSYKLPTQPFRKYARRAKRSKGRWQD